MKPILVVDDEFDLLDTVRSILEGEGYLVVSCESGVRALEAIRREVPAMILLDIMMPGLDGIATLAKIRGEPQWADVPVVLMSAIRPVLAKGGPRVDGFLKKPFALAELLEAVEQQVGRAQRNRETG